MQRINKRRKAISWNIGSGCNYDCSYCVQGAGHTGFPNLRDMEPYKDFFRKIGPGWEVKISGGEPFLFPGLIQVVEWLRESGQEVSVVTNFSFPRGLYRRFFRTAGPGLRSFSVSLHREKADWKKFLKKCRWAAKKIRTTPHGSLVVNSVVEPGKVRELEIIKQAFEAEGIRFYPQLERRKGKPVPFSAEEQEIIARMADNKKPFAINAGFSKTGRQCRAGMNYFVITPEGECYRCYPSKKDPTGAGYLGNIPRGDVKLRKNPAPCPYEICNCTVPLNRGMVEGEKKLKIKNEKLKIKNGSCRPIGANG